MCLLLGYGVAKNQASAVGCFSRAMSLTSSTSLAHGYARNNFAVATGVGLGGLQRNFFAARDAFEALSTTFAERMPVALCNRGGCYLSSGEYDKAYAMFKRAEACGFSRAIDLVPTSLHLLSIIPKRSCAWHAVRSGTAISGGWVCPKTTTKRCWRTRAAQSAVISARSGTWRMLPASSSSPSLAFSIAPHLHDLRSGICIAIRCFVTRRRRRISTLPVHCSVPLSPVPTRSKLYSIHRSDPLCRAQYR